MQSSQPRKGNWVFFLVLGVTLPLLFGGVGVYGIHRLARGTPAGDQRGGEPPAGTLDSVELLDAPPHTLAVPESVRTVLGIGACDTAEAPKRGKPLVVPGSTALDPNRLSRVRTRFNADVMEIGQVREPFDSEPSQSSHRELRTGDQVRKGDVLAVVWSVDVGSRKSDLVDALLQLRLDEERLKARTELWKNGSYPEDALNQTRRDVLSDRNAVDRAERTLRTWNIPEDEIAAVHDEAEKAFQRMGQRDKEKERLWARCRIIAPQSGTIIERNVGLGEFVADNTINLFVIADVSQLVIHANPPEDHLPELLNLKPEEKRWTLRTVGVADQEQPFSEISYLIDANQHTAVLKGYIDNPNGTLRGGQFVSASIPMRPPQGVVEVPLTALAEDGRQSFVFVQLDPGRPQYTMRRVQVTQRFDKTAYVRSELKPEEQKLTPEETKLGLYPREPLRPGDRYLPTGALELRAALEDRESKARCERQER
jgi:cobalt-zinc-cadmium efflux system membrane fusion protein